MPACFPISKYELRPARVSDNYKFLRGNNVILRRSRLSWVRSQNETISDTLNMPFAAVTENQVLPLCLVAHVRRSISSWTREVYAGFHVLDLRHLGFIYLFIWSVWSIFRESKSLREYQEEWCCHSKYKLLPASTDLKLLRTEKMISQAILKTR